MFCGSCWEPSIVRNCASRVFHQQGLCLVAQCASMDLWFSVHSAQKSQVKSERYLGLGPFIMQPGWLWFTLLVYNIFHLIIYCKFYQEGLHTVSNEIFVKIILSHSPTKTVTSNYQIHFLGPKQIGVGSLIFVTVTVPTLFLVIKLHCEIPFPKKLVGKGES